MVNEIKGHWVLFSTILASSMAFIDGTALNVALPTIQRELDASGNELLWIVNSYQLFLAALILVGGSLGDHFGRKRIFGYGIGIFTGASLFCGLAPDPTFLIIARAVQGIGGALMVPGSLAIISALFDSDSKGAAIGTWSAFVTITSILGPIIGGELSELGLWRGVFFINIPLASLALWALIRYVPENYDENVAGQRLDYVGAVLITMSLAGLTYGFIQAPSQGWTDPLILVSLIGGILAVGVFVFWEYRSEHPMMPLRLFKNPTFSGANVMTLFLYGALSGALLFLPLNLVQAQGYSSRLAGRAIVPASLLLAVLSRYSGRVADRIGPRIPLTVGPFIAGIGFLVFALQGITDGFEDYWTTFFPPAILFGLGMGITVAPLTTAVMSSVSQQRSGVASGVNNAVSRTAGVLAVAIFGAIALGVFGSELESRTARLDLSAEQEQAVLDEAGELGDAQVPADVPEERKSAVADVIDESFVEAFQIINYIAAGMAWLSALLAFFMIGKKSAAAN
jgi:EmrB/QacA subfamily drug resistance transporter